MPTPLQELAFWGISGLILGWFCHKARFCHFLLCLSMWYAFAIWQAFLPWMTKLTPGQAWDDIGAVAILMLAEAIIFIISLRRKRKVWWKCPTCKLEWPAGPRAYSGHALKWPPDKNGKPGA